MVRKVSLFAWAFFMYTVTTYGATVNGMVKEGDSTGTAIVKAVVTLGSFGAGGQTQRDTTDSTGAFSFSDVVTGLHQLSAAKTGYQSMQQSTVQVTDSTAAYTRNVYLISTNFRAAISGTVTDSSTDTAIAKAVVVVSRTGTKSDTVVTGSGGKYSFDSLAAGTYTLRVTASGYVSKSTNVTITTASQTVNIKLAVIQYGSIVGVIADSSDGKGISGAKVVLRRGPGTIGTATVDSTVTGSGGAYSFGKVESGSSYSIAASATGYVSRTSATVTLRGTAADTIDVKLLAITYGKITGKVTSDSARGPALSGAKLVLRATGTGGGALDSATSDSEGIYIFNKVQAKQNYSIAASLTGYVSSTKTHNNQTSGTDTVNFALAKIGTGTLYVKVLKRSDSSAIAAVSVVATQTAGGGLALTGATSSTGEAVFDNLEITGATLGFTVTASIANYTAASAPASVPKNGKDTVTIYLTAAVNGTKLITGTVKDSTSKSLLAHVRIVVTVAGTGIGGQSFTFIDSTGSDGKYAIEGIPVTSTQATVSATLTGYRTFNDNTLRLGAANQADTTTLNIALLEATAVKPLSAAMDHGTPEIFITSSGAIRISNITQNGTVTLLGINGRLLLRHALSPHESLLSLPPSLAKRGSAFILNVIQGNKLYRQRIVMP